MDKRIRKGCMVETTGEGRTASWNNRADGAWRGWVTRRRGTSIFVAWLEAPCIEDEMSAAEVRLVEPTFQECFERQWSGSVPFRRAF